MSKDANSFGHDNALAWESRGFVYTKKEDASFRHTLILNYLRHIFRPLKTGLPHNRQRRRKYIHTPNGNRNATLDGGKIFAHYGIFGIQKHNFTRKTKHHPQ